MLLGSRWAMAAAMVGFILVTGSGSATAAPRSGLMLYIAANGNDSWSGRTATRHGGDGPFATLERARDAVRDIRRSGDLPAGGVIVELEAGTYERSAPFELSAEDSGTSAAPIIYRARPGA
jgi:hypothetical protein